MKLVKIKQQSGAILCMTFFIYGLGLSYAETTKNENSGAPDTAKKLYWFIPDGLRADAEVFNLFQWAREGKLPNIKKMMEQGSFGYSMPAFPSHTPVNFASILTGSYPKTHGVADGPMHALGHPLDKVAVPGFSSVAKKVAPIWMPLEAAKKKVVLLAIPGGTPPEMDEGVTIRGRWGGWGADHHALNFQSKGDMSERKNQGRATRLFFFGPQLTNYIDAKPVEGWDPTPKSFSPALEMSLQGWGTPVFAQLTDATDDKKVNYDSIGFSLDKKAIFATLKQGEWSNWQPIQLKWQEKLVDSFVKIKLIKLDGSSENPFFRIRCLYNNINTTITKPDYIATELTKAVGPMVDFVDNFPPQLVYYPEDKPTFLEESNMSFEWHKNATKYILEKHNPDVYIHDIYSPNQMLSSKWWMGACDPNAKHYKEYSDKDRNQLWQEVHEMYEKTDAILGEYLAHADANTYVVLSSDHGMSPLNTIVKLNNLFAKEGLLTFKLDETTGEPIIDWQKTQVIYLKMDNIYINPKGLQGNYERASGPEYEQLRERVIKLLTELKDETGVKPLAKLARWEEVTSVFKLPPDRVGDLVVANIEGYHWDEEMSAGLEIFSESHEAGYKQALLPEITKSVWTPFVIIGPGVKKNYELKEPIQIVDQYPTIMRLLQMDVPQFVEGKILNEIFE